MRVCARVCDEIRVEQHNLQGGRPSNEAILRTKDLHIPLTRSILTWNAIPLHEGSTESSIPRRRRFVAMGSDADARELRDRGGDRSVAPSNADRRQRPTSERLRRAAGRRGARLRDATAP